MKSYNRDFRRYVILNLINAKGPISRTRLTEITGFRPATVGEVAKYLIEEGLVTETGYASSRTGRRREMLDLNRKKICAVGIAASQMQARLVLALFDGTIVREEVCKGAPGCSQEELVQMITETTGHLLDLAEGLYVAGIGIGDPPYDPTGYQKGVSISANYGHFNDWTRLILRPELEKRYSLPVGNLSAVTLPALVERQYGMAKGSDNFICVELSNGIGTSIFLEGSPISGTGGMAGELGHTVVDIHSKSRCYCGKTGCVEIGASFPEVVRELREAIENGAVSSLDAGNITVESLHAALEAKDELCLTYVAQAAEQAGCAIANAINLLNPEMVILYGFMLKLGSFYLDRLTEAILGRILELNRGCRICTSPELESKLPIGAAAEMFTRFLRRDDYQWVYSMLGEENLQVIMDEQ